MYISDYFSYTLQPDGIIYLRHLEPLESGKICSGCYEQLKKEANTETVLKHLSEKPVLLRKFFKIICWHGEYQTFNNCNSPRYDSKVRLGASFVKDIQIKPFSIVYRCQTSLKEYAIEINHNLDFQLFEKNEKDFVPTKMTNIKEAVTFLDSFKAYIDKRTLAKYYEQPPTN